MKKIILWVTFSIGMFSSSGSLAGNNKHFIPTDDCMEQKIESILQRMTLEEKIGQMTQLTLDVVGQGSSIYESHLPFVFDEALLDTVMHKYKVGSILNTVSNTPLTIEEWTRIIMRLQQEAIKAMGIPLVYGVDQIHGVTYTIDGTLFPQPIGMGATFNPELVYRGAQVAAYESRAGSVPWTFSPTLDLGRDARWPRIWEQYGEDTYLISEMGKAVVKGYQGDDPNRIGKYQVAACAKHYMGYGASFSGKDRTPAYIAENELRERHFQPFLEAIKAGALSVMGNSGTINGIPVHANYILLTKWLKEDLNWDGVIVTDWADINNLYTRDKVAATKKEAVKMAINAGVDMSMVPYEWSFCVYLKELVEEQQVSMERIDDAVRRVLRMKARLGLFERPHGTTDEYPDFGSEKHARLALESAGESITLLKNTDGLLPLPQHTKLLITGPNADSMRCLNGGWTLSWQGEKSDLYAGKYNTIREAFVHTFGRENVIYEPGVTYKTANPPTTDIPYWAENEPEIEKAVKAAANVDVIIACVGENSYCETPGNLDDLALSTNQRKLIKALARTNKPIVLVLNEGRPRVISDIEPLVKAVVHTYLPGNYGGDALANIVSGKVNPSGKLPYTYPKFVNTLINYDYKPAENLGQMAGAYNYDAVAAWQWGFGHGLSYTTFGYKNLRVDKKTFTADELLHFAVEVTNTGKRKGKETVMLFSSDRVASLTPDVRRLRAFSKVELEPDETKTVTLQVNTNNLAFVGADGRWRLEAGEFGIQIGTETTDIMCTSINVWNTPNR